jgi:hypothetical protein
MELIEGSETSANYNLTPGKYPEEQTQYAEDVKILGESVLTMKKNTDDLVVASNEIGPEENADKTKYVFTSRDQNTG